MANVNAVEGIAYGFRLIGYMIAVFIIGSIMIGIGAVIVDSGGSEALVGGLIILVGSLATFAGVVGVQYKLIADGVEKGMSAAQTGDTAGQQDR